MRDMQWVMSRSLTENAAEALERKARNKVTAIRRAVGEYNQSLDATNDAAAGQVLRKQREMDRIVADYVELYKAIKRIRKKLGTDES
jgi:hypothetical protein